MLSPRSSFPPFINSFPIRRGFSSVIPAVVKSYPIEPKKLDKPNQMLRNTRPLRDEKIAWRRCRAGPPYLFSPLCPDANKFYGRKTYGHQGTGFVLLVVSCFQTRAQAPRLFSSSFVWDLSKREARSSCRFRSSCGSKNPDNARGEENR